MNETEQNSLATNEVEGIKQENEELKEVLSAVQVDLEKKTEVSRARYTRLHLSRNTYHVRNAIKKMFSYLN